MDHFKFIILGSASRVPEIKDAANLDPLCIELLPKLTGVLDNELAFGISAAKNCVYLNFNEKPKDQYTLLTM